MLLAELFLPISRHRPHSLLKMSSAQLLLTPDPELINAKSLDFAKPKLFFKNIGCYAATSTYIQVRIPFNSSQILDAKNTIEHKGAVQGTRPNLALFLIGMLIWKKCFSKTDSTGSTLMALLA
jgi:hypothetical protein